MRTISILLLLLLVTGSLSAQQASPSTERPAAGIVNGDTVWLDEYSREVGRRAQMNQLAGERSPSDVIEDAWKAVIRQTVFRQKAAAMGIEVTYDEIRRLLLNDPPDYVKQGVVDDKGAFDADLLRGMITNPDSLVRARAGKANPSAIAEQIRQVRQSIDGLFAQVQQQLLTQRLSERIKSQTTIDSTRLYERYLQAATTANVDVIYLPCADVPADPGYEILEAYYTAHQDRYVSDRELRRLAIMTWPFVASPVDSTLMLGNIGAFVESLNAARTDRERDSIWNDVAATVPSGSTRLHPDSASHQNFYTFVKGKKRGAALGPIMHPTGVHILLVDSVLTEKGASGKVYAVRVIITDIDPSRETVDSTLKEVHTAVEMYERGRVLGEIANSFQREIELSPYFGSDNKLYESYRLVDAAFEARVAQMLDPVDSPERGAIVAVVIDSVPAGPLPFDAAMDRVLVDWQIEQACLARETDMKKIRTVVSVLDDGRMLIGAPLPGATIFRDITVDPGGLIGDQILDPLASKAICDARDPGVMGPFRGDAGWYVVNVHYVVRPNPDDYPLYLKLNGETLAEEQRQDHWNHFLDHLTDDAEIVDQRYLYFRY